MIQKRHRLRRVAGRLIAERVRYCGRHRHSQTVDIHRSEHGAHVVGVETCGSVWHCPVCAAKIAENRREEVASVMDGIRDLGGASYMLTLTMKHGRDDTLEFLKEQIVNGWRKVQNRKAWRAIKHYFKIIGTIRAIEVTHGANGWHPHLHVLIAMDKPLSEYAEEVVKDGLYALWKGILEKQSNRHVSLDALDFRQATASDYVTKWGTDRELVKGHEKQGRQGGRTPWQLLDDYDKGDAQAGALFREYALTFKGANQLTWSKGLRLYKRMMGIDDIDDMEAASAPETINEELPLDDKINLKVGRLGSLPGHVYNVIVRKELTAELLEAAFREGWQGVTTLLAVHGIHIYDPDAQAVEPEERACAESYRWQQPPKGGRPAHPKYYLKWNQKEFMSYAAKSVD